MVIGQSAEIEMYEESNEADLFELKQINFKTLRAVPAKLSIMDFQKIFSIFLYFLFPIEVKKILLKAPSSQKICCEHFKTLLGLLSV